MKKCFLFAIAIFTATQLFAQFKFTPEQQRIFDSIQQVTHADYKTMLAQLHIDSTRPGPSGNPQAPNGANSDESKVPPYTLPDPLTLSNGKKVTDAKIWWNNAGQKLLNYLTKKYMAVFLPTHQR